MILNEDYFKDLDIKNEDIVTDDVEEPKLAFDDVRKLPEQYKHCIHVRIDKYRDVDTLFYQTSLIPRIFKRINTIFDMYGIEHYENILTSYY